MHLVMLEVETIKTSFCGQWHTFAFGSFTLHSGMRKIGRLKPNKDLKLFKTGISIYNFIRTQSTGDLVLWDDENFEGRTNRNVHE